MCEAAPEQPPPLRLLQLLLPPPRPLQHDRRRRTPYRCRNHNRVGTDSASLFLAALDRKHHHTTCRAVQPMPLWRQVNGCLAERAASAISLLIAFRLLLLIGALLAVVIINQGCIDSCLTAVLAARLKAADILAVRVTTVRDGNAALPTSLHESASEAQRVTLLVGDAASAFHWP